MFGNNTTKIKVGGMMCDHCVATVKKSLEEIEGVSSVSVELKKGEVSVKHKGDFPEEKIKEALTKNDYTFAGVIR